jgi:hypothetical protein
MGIQVHLCRAGERALGLPDPSGGRFDAAGDFDRLLPATAATFPLLGRVDPYNDVGLEPDLMPNPISEIDELLPLARQGPEQRGLLRLRTLADLCARTTESSLIFLGD